MHTMFKMITSKELLYSTGNCSMLCGSLDGRGVWAKMDTCVCLAESPCCSPKTVTLLLTRCTPIQNKKLNIYIYIYIEGKVLGIPWSPGVRIWHFHCQGQGSIPDRGTKIL